MSAACQTYSTKKGRPHGRPVTLCVSLGTVVISAILGDVVVRQGLPFRRGTGGSSGHLLGLGLLFTLQPTLYILEIVSLDLYLDKVDRIRSLDRHCIERGAVRLGIFRKVAEIVVETFGILLRKNCCKLLLHVLIADHVSFPGIDFHIFRQLRSLKKWIQIPCAIISEISESP